MSNFGTFHFGKTPFFLFRPFQIVNLHKPTGFLDGSLPLVQIILHERAHFDAASSGFSRTPRPGCLAKVQRAQVRARTSRRGVDFTPLRARNSQARGRGWVLMSRDVATERGANETSAPAQSHADRRAADVDVGFTLFGRACARRKTTSAARVTSSPIIALHNWAQVSTHALTFCTATTSPTSNGQGAETHGPRPLPVQHLLSPCLITVCRRPLRRVARFGCCGPRIFECASAVL